MEQLVTSLDKLGKAFEAYEKMTQAKIAKLEKELGESQKAEAEAKEKVETVSARLDAAIDRLQTVLSADAGNSTQGELLQHTGTTD